MTEMTDRDALDALFDQARACPEPAGPEFMARVLADAERLQPAPRGAEHTVPVRGRSAVARRGWLARLSQALGGAAVVAGIGSAAMAGLVVGYVQPDALVSLTDSYSLAAEADGLDLMPGYDMLYADEVAQ
jgi:hypothetical protein